LRWSAGTRIPFGEAADAAMAPALVNARAMAAMAAVRLPLHRADSGGAEAATPAIGAYGASCGTVSWISDRGRTGIGVVCCGTGTVCGEPDGTVNPGGGDPGGWTVTPAEFADSL
jgi:hypothetical protein